AQVAIVSQELAAELWPHTDPLGQTILVGEGVREVIGVARDAKYESVWERTAPYLYLPSSGAASNVVVNTLVAPLSLEAPLRKALAPHAIIRFTTGSDLVNAALAPQRLSTLLLCSFATLAIILGSIGVGSALSYFVRRNTREIGVRLAIGASP